MSQFSTQFKAGVEKMLSLSIFGTTTEAQVYSATANDYNEAIPSYASGVSVIMAILPAIDEDIQIIPEGERVDGMLIGYLKIDDKVALRDKIVSESISYDVFKEEVYKVNGLELFQKIWLKKIQ